jgi:hypothetical protein
MTTEVQVKRSIQNHFPLVYRRDIGGRNVLFRRGSNIQGRQHVRLGGKIFGGGNEIVGANASQKGFRVAEMAIELAMGDGRISEGETGESYERRLREKGRGFVLLKGRHFVSLPCFQMVFVHLISVACGCH